MDASNSQQPDAEKLARGLEVVLAMTSDPGDRAKIEKLIRGLRIVAGY